MSLADMFAPTLALASDREFFADNRGRYRFRPAFADEAPEPVGVFVHCGPGFALSRRILPKVPRSFALAERQDLMAVCWRALEIARYPIAPAVGAPALSGAGASYELRSHASTAPDCRPVIAESGQSSE